MVRVARDLLAFACDAGAPDLASFLLPTASMGCGNAAALVTALESRDDRSRSSLLHRALRSKCTAMVEGLLSWGTQTGYQWQVPLILFEALPLSLCLVALSALTLLITICELKWVKTGYR